MANDDDNAEEWRVIPDFKSYEISNHGRVRLARSFKQYPKGHLLKLKKNIDGYYVVNLRKDKRYYEFRINRLVLMTFKGPSPNRTYHAAHNDGNRINNRIENLRWATPRENEQDKVFHGTLKGAHKGERHHNAKLTDDLVKKIRDERANGMTFIAIAEKYGLKKLTIYDAITGNTWSHVK